MRKLLALLILLGGCNSIAVPPQYQYKEINTGDFVIASWQKPANPKTKICLAAENGVFQAL